MPAKPISRKRAAAGSGRIERCTACFTAHRRAKRKVFYVHATAVLAFADGVLADWLLFITGTKGAVGGNQTAEASPRPTAVRPSCVDYSTQSFRQRRSSTGHR